MTRHVDSTCGFVLFDRENSRSLSNRQAYPNVANLIYLLTLPLLLMAFYRLKLARFIEDQPDSTIGGAAQGIVEIKARTLQLDTQPLIVPILDMPCAWFRIETSVFDEDKKAVVARESYQRFYVTDHTGVCAVDPLHAEVMPRKIKEIQDGNTHHTITWIGIGDDIYVLGWMKSLHPRPRTDDRVGGFKQEWNDPDAVIRRYGQLKKKLDRITRSPFPGIPFLISTYYEHRLVDRLKRQAKYWFVGFFIAVIGVHVVLTLWQG